MPAPALSPWRRNTLLALLALWLVVVVGSQFVIPPLIAGAFDGESSITWLNKKIANHRAYRVGAGLDGSREWYVDWAQSYALKASALTTLGVLTAGALIASRRARRRVKRFLFASAAPLNLAVLRIAAFGMLLYLLRTEPIMTYAAWPPEMYEWPLIAGLFKNVLPVTPAVVGPTLAVATVTTTCALVGFLTRLTAPVSVLLGWYLIGVPQLSGKVNHLHHVMLIGLVVALARCADTLSIDSLWRAVRRADTGIVAPPRRAVRYGLPIRVAMLVLATVYFFPGFWKLATNGPKWVFSNNLENHMLQKWFELEHYRPPVPLHEMPFSGQMGSLFALVFELGIPLALLWKPTRALWGLMGITFHNLTNLLMKISFITLQVMYVMFVDWQRLFRGLGRRVFGAPMRVLYDGNCGLCRRTMAVLGVCDWLEQLKPINALDRAAVEAEGLEFLEDADLVTDMHAAWPDETTEWGVERGYAAYQAIAWRVPLLWPTLLVVYLPPVAAIGRAVYRRVADSRACRLPSTPPGGAARPLRSNPRWSWRPFALITGAMLAGQCLLGVGRLHKSWPLACYPLFDQMAERTIVWPEFEALEPTGETVPLDDDPLRDRLGNGRYVASMQRFIVTPLDEQAAGAMISEFASIWREAGLYPEEPPTAIRVFLAKYELTGPERPAAPVERTKLIDLAVHE
ncbi:DCC1-like thiol-disulfide oxidoreductase family protein [Botrimarina hoheduenensis]|uniref:Vitamin K-dependent gamma-carboxylase n=1 Tax=Botrimarina hoheduenensis TaxID=2528000 RepID=A0A5C5W7Q3_9BACT|nr:DCC1-like thiol-disulfide oxidoreductase family protein [Botrimarina hoheduenensis]TWT46928.1 Vitamin K-dependent gamma-carboxylase [Botrimarina hoheduenensis]